MLPNINIETPRLFLRPFLESDLEGIFRLDSDPRVHKYLGNQPITDRNQAQQSILNILAQYEKNGMGRSAVIIKKTNEFIGWGGIKKQTEFAINDHINYYDLGYRIIPEYWQKGYGYEIGMASVEIGFKNLGLGALHASAAVENIGSNRILQRLGMEKINSFRHHDTECNWYELRK